jgi:hypothetical protein
MIYNLVSTVLMPGKIADWNEIVSKEFMPLSDKHSFKLAGDFHGYTGNMNEHYWIWAYEDLTSMKKMLEDFRKDINVQKVMVKLAALAVSQTFTLLEPNPWSPMK